MTAQLQLTTGGVGFPDGSEQPTAAQPSIIDISASISTNAITVTLAPCSLAFRDTTLTTGMPTYVKTSTALTLTIAATDSFGLTTAFGSQRIAILAFNDAGTMRLAASALYGGVKLDEINLLSATTTATTATAIDAGVVITSKAYRVVGFVDVTFTTAVGWGSLAQVQGVGGQALAAMSSLGFGQTWQSITMVNGTTYYNTGGKPITLQCQGTSTTTWNYVINGYTLPNSATSSGNSNATAIVPPGASYGVIGFTSGTQSVLK